MTGLWRVFPPWAVVRHPARAAAADGVVLGLSSTVMVRRAGRLP
ncbi:hypothetical protein [Streptomyces sp. NPDC046870]